MLQENGFRVETIWACDYTATKDSSDLDENIGECITMKDCYFGGCTNALTLYKKIDEGEKGYYIDFTSLYPSVLKYKHYPTGWPECIIKDFAPLTVLPHCPAECRYHDGEHIHLAYFGLIKATFLPPMDLHIPVLPVRINGKLKFPLCFTCAQKEEQAVCKCSDRECMFTQTYCTPEVEVALNSAYKIVKIFEVLHWEQSEVYSEEKKEGGLFTEYINTFLKIK